MNDWLTFAITDIDSHPWSAFSPFPLLKVTGRCGEDEQDFFLPLWRLPQDTKVQLGDTLQAVRRAQGETELLALAYGDAVLFDYRAPMESKE